MPIIAADIKFFESTFTDGTTASLGGAITANELPGTLNGLWDNVTGDEAAAGETTYRCWYVQNTHGSLTLQTSIFSLLVDTAEGDTSMEFGLDPAGVNGTAVTIANESAAPVGVVFTAGEPNDLAIGDIPFSQFQAVWGKRVINAGAIAVNGASRTVDVRGQTAA